jgi:signal transduction histidine kinase
MRGLRSKILIGFGGLVVLLVIFSVVGEVVIDRYSRALQRSFGEDYESAAVCEDFAHSVDRIDTSLQLHFWNNVPLNAGELETDRQICNKNLASQRAIATLPGEKETTDQLGQFWAEYQQIYPRLLDQSISADQRRDDYARLALPKAMQVQDAANALIHMNMGSMLSVHGRVRSLVARFKWAMHLLSGVAVALAIVYAVLIGRFILRPVQIVTQSVREIERGNLDLRVPVQSRDELGVLAEAVNAMAAQLLAYRRADHERLVRTERTTQLAIDSLPDVVIVLDPNGKIELANETAKRLFHLNPGTAAIQSQPPWLMTLHRRTLDSPGARTSSGYESTIQVEDGGEARHFLPRTVPIVSESGQAIGATIVLADVSGLRRLDEMKNGLLSLISHELKTPLTSLRMIMHLVTGQRVGPLTAKQQELLDTGRDDAEKLHLIVENLLDMERIESGRALMELQAVAPADLARAAAESVRATFEMQQVDLQVDVGDLLPAVSADPTRMSHVLVNLLNNALRHTSAGGHVRLWARVTDDWVETGVSDNGCGIPKQYLPRVFEKFFRVPGQSGSTGSGLGLAIAKDIIEAHGGRIRAESVEETGTTIAFTLRQAIDAETTGLAQEPAFSTVSTPGVVSN